MLIEISNFDLILYKFNKLHSEDGVDHFISGRNGGVSKGEVGALNLSFNALDTKDNVNVNRRLLADTLGIPLQRLLFPQQTHSTNVRIVEVGTTAEELSDTDALITSVPGVCLSVMSADCVPVLVYDRRRKVAAAIHAGWKGTVNKIVDNTLNIMINELGCDAADMVAGIGPSICQQVYEVGDEVISAVEQVFPDADVLIPGAHGKAHFDLWKANKLQLLQKGVPAGQIEVAGICTYLNNDKFFSARRSKQAGRFATGILIR